MSFTAPRRLALRGWLLVPFVLLLACAGIRVGSDRDPEADLSAYRTYAWLEEPVRERARGSDTVPLDPFTHNSLLDGRLRAELDAQLQALGLEPAARDEADVWVRYQVVARDEVDSGPGVSAGGYFGPGIYGSGLGYYGGGVTTYRQGTLVVDMIDPDSRRITWRGWADRRSRGPHVDTERLRAAVEHILDEFPTRE